MFTKEQKKNSKGSMEERGVYRLLICKRLTAETPDCSAWLAKSSMPKSRGYENFQGILERVWIALKDCGPGQELQGHILSLTAKEKLSEG